MDFMTALQAAKQEKFNIVIPDIKCRSPKEGDLLEGRDPLKIAEELIAAGAPVLSVVTEERNFGGSKLLLQQISSLGVPVLRKDFIHTKAEIHETKALGALAVLLMYSCLDDHSLRELYYEATSIGLNVLVETHTEEELQNATKLGARLIGINNRDISILEKDNGTVALTEQLAGGKPDGCFLVSESGIQSPKDVRNALSYGANAALVGTALLKAKDIRSFYRKLSRPVRIKLCGMMSTSDIQICSRADILGFVVNYPENVPWNISSEKARLLLGKVPAECESCIVTGGTPEKVISLAKELKPTFVQLHHNESLEQTESIVHGLSKIGIKVIRSISCSEQKRRQQFKTSSLDNLAKTFAEMGVSELLVDSRSHENAATANGNTPIHTFLELKSCSPIPVMLAGGIKPSNIQRIIGESGADRIDVMTGIEALPGVKSRRATDELFNQIGG